MLLGRGQQQIRYSLRIEDEAPSSRWLKLLGGLPYIWLYLFLEMKLRLARHSSPNQVF
jgi:hypothetical protein